MADDFQTMNGNTRFSFAVVGDCKSDISLIPSEPFRQNIRAINLLGPDFVIFLGDFIKGDTIEALLEEAWEEFYRVVKSPQIPYHLVVGNHDEQYSSSRELFERKHGKPYYSFDYQNSHFIVLDSEEENDGKNCIAGGQLEWLRQDLEAHRDVQHIFVFLHKPLWEIGTSNWNRVVHPLLAEYRVELVFAGHKHLYQEPIVRDGVKYIVTGGGGSPLSVKEMEGGFYHWVHVLVKGKDVKFAVIRPEGVISERGIPLPSWQQVNWIQKKSFGPAFIDATREVPFAENISVKIRNPFDLPVYGSIVWSCPEGWEILPERREYLIEPRSDIDLAFEIRAWEWAKMAYPLPCYEAILHWDKGDCPIATGRRGVRLRKRFVCKRIDHHIKINGRLDDWRGFEPLCLDRRDQVVGPWAGPDDLSAKVFLAWDEKCLYFAALVQDDCFSQPYSAENTWQGDS
ncbi:MAG: metallophosphoesterase, partial [Thermodesulfobacteriota bacterium]